MILSTRNFSTVTASTVLSKRRLLVDQAVAWNHIEKLCVDLSSYVDLLYCGLVEDVQSMA